MPELPEVETIARTLSPLVRGRRITAVDLRYLGCVEAGSLPLNLLVGRYIADTGRRGKLALLHLQPCAPASVSAHGVRESGQETHVDGVANMDEPAFVAVHLKMTGRLFAYGAEQKPGPHTRLVLHLEARDGTLSQVFFDDARKFGYVRLNTPRTLYDWKFWNTLGPEPLESTIEALAARLAGRGGSGVKSVLLNQTMVAGIGNIYADEALFRAGIDPRAKISSLTHARLCTLFIQVREVLLESIEQCGSSIRDYRTARGDAGAFQNTFRVYGRSGKCCVSCGCALTTASVAGRTTVFCPHCQK